MDHHWPRRPKRQDAIAMLRVMRDRMACDPAPKQVHFTLQETKFWNRAMREAQNPVSDRPADASATVPDVRLLLRQLGNGSGSLLDLFIDGQPADGKKA